MQTIRDAIKGGDPERVRALVSAGADPLYVDENGYDALIEAVHSDAMKPGGRLIELLALLIGMGVRLSGVSSYNEAAVRVLSRVGRFDDVRFLLKAGADAALLEWNDLMHAVALGSLDDVRRALDAGAPLEERDWWGRTAWLIAIAAGDIEKAKLLLEHGADRQVRGRGGRPALFEAIECGQPQMVRWLLEDVGVDIKQTDGLNATPVSQAASHDEVKCLEVLLEFGASIDGHGHLSPLWNAQSREATLLLLGAGADPAEADQRLILGLPSAKQDASDPAKLIEIATPADFASGRARAFGSVNPERMNKPFWLAMIRSGVNAYQAKAAFGVDGDYGEPVWCADRFGQSLTLMPDGRAIQIGGEHEDFYDPDFCIYNDVFVHHPGGQIDIYGYPEELFPPTDFHTATLVGEWIYVIGRLGYQRSRGGEHTPVFRLDTRTLRMERVETTGTSPGWIHEHRARLVAPHQIRVWGGEVLTKDGEKEIWTPNKASFVLDVKSMHWTPDAQA